MRRVGSIVVMAACIAATSACGFETGATTARASAESSTDTVRGDKTNSIAWAPLADADRVTVEGSVPSSRAWSTSKVLVVAAYLDAVVRGNPDRIPRDVRSLIRAALEQSDDRAILAIRHLVPDCGRVMARILRSIGDKTTEVPAAFEGTMQWTVREQVRFMAALGNGEVITPRASEFLLDAMQPVPEQRWGIGRIGARAFKPGWNAGDESRQMGIVGDFAVAIITTGGASAQPGDFAHARQLDRLARTLAARLDESRCLRSSVFGWQHRWC